MNKDNNDRDNSLQRPPSDPTTGRDTGKSVPAPDTVPSKVEDTKNEATASSSESTRVQQAVKQGKKAPPKKRRRKPRVRVSTVIGAMVLNVLKSVLVLFCIGLMVFSILAVQVVQYVVSETQNDDNILDLENIKLNQTSYIMALDHENPNAREENDWVEYQELIGPENRIWVPLNDIPDDLINAVVATEDRLFYEHHGVSFERTAYALANELFQFEDRSFGASTIDQQLVKNLTGDDDVTDEEGDMTVGYKRKMREIFRAWGLNNRYSKDMIMEAYLNTMSLSERIAGVQAGALEYFGKDVKDLTLTECATIAGVTRAPTYYSPFQNPGNSLQRRNSVLLFMYEEGYIDKATFDKAIDEPLGVTRRTTKEDSEDSRTIFNYFSDAVFEDVVADFMEQQGMSREQAIEQIYTGGYRIYATVDQNVQLALEDIYLDGYAEDGFFLDPSRFPGYAARLTITEQETDEEGNVLSETQVMPQSAAVVINYDGELVGVVGGIGEKTESLSLNRAIGTVDEEGNVVGTVRQVGSTMKPIAAYALGIDYGIITYSKGVRDAGVLSRDPSRPNAKDWPKNFSNRYRNSNIPIASAIAESTNTVAAQVGLWVGRETMFEFLTETLQVSSLVQPHDVDLGPLVMGSMTYGMSLYELAGAYQMFGGNETYGVYNSLHSYLRVEDSRGNIVMEPEMTTVQAINPQSGYVMNRLLSNVLHGSSLPGGASPTARGMGPEGEMDSVAKTGTTSDDKDRLFVGLTPYYVTAVWWGYDEEHDFNGRWSPSASTNVPPNVWKSLMETVQEDLPVREFPAQPDGIEQLSACTISGERARAGCPTMQGYFCDFAIPDYCGGHRSADPAAPEAAPAEAPPA
ncbi:penicillin-binding protein [Ruminococcaceae bacterium OttesenSCG-928-I18]|nr:penicillin-binding protein [Ruminococcaceae bacterium OttesenSCG-928-I18]